MAICLDFDWQTNEFMLYCRTTQLREKTMLSYEQTLRLFEKWCKEEQGSQTLVGILVCGDSCGTHSHNQVGVCLNDGGELSELLSTRGVCLLCESLSQGDNITIDGITCGLLHNISFLVASWQLRFVLGSLPFNYCFGRGFLFLISLNLCTLIIQKVISNSLDSTHL